MALSMDEQRILDEIERGLASADPALATRMSSFGAPRRLTTLRMRRLRLVASLMTLLVVAWCRCVVYALVPFRSVTDRHGRQQGQLLPGPPGDDRAVAPRAFGVRAGQCGQASAPGQRSPPARAPPSASRRPRTPAASQAPSTHAGTSASPASAHQQERGTPAQ